MATAMNSWNGDERRSRHSEAERLAAQASLFTGCGICGSTFCPHQRCRMCGSCDLCDQAMTEKPATAPAQTSAKPDPDEQDRLEQRSEERRKAIAEIEGVKCPTCSRRKRAMQSFCKNCFTALPKQIRSGLYLSFAGGFLPFYRRAKEILLSAK
jgi:ribosomal protein L32